MKIIFLSGKFVEEEGLANALLRCIPLEGDEIEVMDKPFEPTDLDADMVGIVGLKGREWYHYCRANGQRILYFDKGYYPRRHQHKREFSSWRVSVDTQQPLTFLENAKQPSDRWQALRIGIRPWQPWSKDGHIVIANSSTKYHRFYGLPNPAEWVENIVRELRKYTDRKILYRPKPSFTIRGGAMPIDGTVWAPFVPLGELFDGCHALITHGSYISVDALLAGTPGIILGDAVTRSISSRSLSEIEFPYRASDDERLRLLSNLAYCQYKTSEWYSGKAWPNVKRLLIQ